MQADRDVATAKIGARAPRASGPDVSGARFLQPQGFGRIFANTFAIYVRNFRAISLIYILPLLPIALLREVYNNSLDPEAAILFVMSLFEFLSFLLIGAALVVAVSDICIGVQPSIRRSYRRGFANARLVPTYFLTVISIAGGLLLLVVPGLVFWGWWMFIIPVVVLENTGGRAAMRRSRQLGHGHYLRNLAVFVTVIIVVLLVAVLIGVLIGIIAFFQELPIVVVALVAVANGIVLGPLINIPLILLYYDLRARKEGYGAAQLVEDLRI